MKYFLDTEFIEDGKTIDLISIGIVCQDGREYYAINSECDFSKASDWVEDNVLRPIGLSRKGFNQNPGSPEASANYKNSYAQAKNRLRIKEDLLIVFAGGVVDPVKSQSLDWDEAVKDLSLWGNYCAYDFVAFAQLMSLGDRASHNPMVDSYPQGLPYFICDLQQEAYKRGVKLDQVVPQSNEHHALADARWNKEAYDYLFN